MATTLILAEKPSVARGIADALGLSPVKKEGYLEVGDKLITWAIGHLADQGKPEDYDSKYKDWRFEDLPVMPTVWKILPRNGDSAKQLKIIGELMKRADEIVNACDAGREGELIFRLIYSYHKCHLPVKRLWVSSLTKEAIQKGFASLEPGAKYDNLYASALARSRGDWLVGMNATRAFTIRFRPPEGGVFSVGRVQTPTLALLVRREREIQNFVPEDYHTIKVTLLSGADSFLARWEGPDGPRLSDQAKAQAIATKIERDRVATVKDSKVEEVQEYPPQLFDLTTLQREANKKYSLTAAKTLEAAQALYEAKHITYPRTDSRYLSDDIAKMFPTLVPKVLGLSDYVYLKGQLNQKHALRKAVVDASKVSDHHAIIPTADVPSGPLAGDLQKVYDLIVRRFLANFMPPAVDRKVRLELDAAGEKLVATGKKEVSAGWRVAEPRPAKPKVSAGKAKEDDDEDAQDGPVPELPVGAKADVNKAEVESKQTKPPRRYSEAGLLEAMETAGRGIPDDQLKEAMKGRGLGTPATRAAIIERLKEVSLIAPADRKALAPTPKGIRLIELVTKAGVERLASPELTGEWELRLHRIAEGKENAGALDGDMRAYTTEIVEHVKGAASVPTEADQNWPPCPVCGSQVVSERFEVRCSGSGCGLKISKRILNRPLEADDVQDLLANGRTSLLGGFVSSRTGKIFSAALVLRTDGSGIEFDFGATGTPKPAPAAPSGETKGTRGTGGGGKRTASGRSKSGSAGGARSPGPSRKATSGGGRAAPGRP